MPESVVRVATIISSRGCGAVFDPAAQYPYLQAGHKRFNPAPGPPQKLRLQKQAPHHDAALQVDGRKCGLQSFAVRAPGSSVKARVGSNPAVQVGVEGPEGLPGTATIHLCT